MNRVYEIQGPSCPYRSLSDVLYPPPNIESLERCSSDPLPTSPLSLPKAVVRRGSQERNHSTWYWRMVEKLKSCCRDRDLGLVTTRLNPKAATKNLQNFKTFNSQLPTILMLSGPTIIQTLEK